MKFFLLSSRRKKLRYVPGLFTLLGFPILLIVIQPENRNYKTVVRINIPSDDTRADDRFSEAAVSKFLATKKVEKMDMDEDIHDNWGTYQHERKKAFIIHEVERLQFLADTNRILQIKFGKKSTYSDIVYVINLARLYRFDRYILLNESFYFIPTPPTNFFDETESSEEEHTRPYKPPTSWVLFKRDVEEKCQALSDKLDENLVLVYAFFVLILLPASINLLQKLKNTIRSDSQYP